MKIRLITELLLPALVLLTIAGCSGKEDIHTAVVQGQITVSDSVDASNDYSGIGITIIQKDSANADADTLFHQPTNKDGNFSGTANFERNGQYPAIVSRNGKNLGRFGIILAGGDTVHIESQLPNVQGNLSIQSKEHDALATYRRVEKGFARVAQFAGTGRLKGDSLSAELNKWSNLFWQVYEKHKGTLASGMAASEAVRLLHGWNNEAMMKKIRKIQYEDALTGIAASYGKNYLAEKRGLDQALGYLDTLQTETESEEMSMRIQMERIKLLFDSAKVDRAKEELSAFKGTYEQNKEVKEWMESISYDLSYLSPGDSIPSFSFTDDAGEIISRDSLMGTPYILEISALANALYQEQFDRTVVIHSLYKMYGLEIVTLPLDQSQVTVNAFFEERVKAWPVAPVNAFDHKALLEEFNIQLVPTRFLIDRNGKIVRKYVGREYTDIIKGIQMLIKKEKPSS